MALATRQPTASRIRELIERELRLINADRGTTSWDDPDRISFGYLGNVYFDGSEDRVWGVFLPHPGRPGTWDEMVGRVTSDDHDGFARILAWVIDHRDDLVAYTP